MPTKNMRSSNWSECNLIRWVEGKLSPVGGQTLYAYSLGSRCKRIHSWHSLSGRYYIAYVCEQNVYVDTGESNLIEITPAGGWPASWPLSEGGYGDLNYSDDLYGTPRASGTILPTDKIPNAWSVDNFGALLLVMYSLDGRLLFWDPGVYEATPSPLPLLTEVTGTTQTYAPHGRSFVVTQQEFVMIFGMYDDGTPLNPDGTQSGGQRRFGWCDQGDLNAWDFDNVTSQSGYYDIEPASPIVAADSGRFGTLFFTATKAYVSQYIGVPFVHNYVELADEATPWSPASIVTTSSYMLWMSSAGMYSFDGNTISPIMCQVRTWINDDIDIANVREEACAVHLSDFSEWWWFYPQNGQLYNTRCVIYNYKEGWWSEGQMSRSAGITSSYTAHPILADGTQVFRHEYGTAYANVSAGPYAETYDLNLTSGTKLCTLKQVIPDVGGDMPNVQFSFYTRMSRSLPPGPGIWTTPVPIRPDGYVDARVTGRGLRMRISTILPVIQPFTLGQHLIDYSVRGDR